MSEQDLRKRVSRGVAWIGMASSAVGVLDVVTLVLLLKFWVTREQLGIATLATTLFPILDVAADLGLMAALIAKGETSPERTSTVFWMNLTLSLVTFVLLLAFAPAGFEALQGQRIAGWLFVGYGTKLVFQNFYTVPWTLMRAELRFKELSVVRIVANVAEMITKIGFAWAGMPVWCFLFGPLARNLVTGIGVQICHPWRPRWVFQFRETRPHLVFGLKTSLSRVLIELYNNLDYQVVGYFFGEASLGLYRFVWDLVLYPVRFISEIITGIAFPAFARLRTHAREVVEQFIAFSRQNLVLVSPYVALVVVAAGELLEVAARPEYAVGATAARFLCIVGLLRGLSHIIPPLLDGIGYPGLTTIYTAVAVVVLPAAFVLFAILLPWLDFQSVAIAWVVAYPIAFAVLVWLGLGRIQLGAGSYFRRLLGIPACALLAALPALVVRRLLGGAPPLARLLAVAAVLLGAYGLLLARLVGIGPRSVARALGKEPKNGA